MENTEQQYNETGCWLIEDLGTKEHAYDKHLSRAISEYLKFMRCESSVDLGCGLGMYVKFLNYSGIPTEGYDGNPYTEQLTKGECKVLDLAHPIEIGTFDWAISLEVGEHIPEEFEQTFIDNVVNCAKKGAIISWAIEGQGGYGHVNCKNNDYIKSEFLKRGFVPQVEAETVLRERSELDWFKNTIMVFRRDD
jgi:hypothetical protein